MIRGSRSGFNMSKISIALCPLVLGLISCVDTRHISDKEWQSSDIGQRVLNERRNECALNDDVRGPQCLIWDQD